MTKPGKLREEYAKWTTHPDRCAICWIPTRRLMMRFSSQLDLAHIISRARGGDAGNVVGNVLFLCSSCHGSQHMSGYTFGGVKWPEIRARHLMKAKLELGELDKSELAGISGYMPGYILDLTKGLFPPEIISERQRWK